MISRSNLSRRIRIAAALPMGLIGWMIIRFARIDRSVRWNISAAGYIALALLLATIYSAAAIKGARGGEAPSQYDPLTIQQRSATPLATPPLLNGTAGLRFPPGFSMAGGRPSSCPTIRWCGCWLQHYFGLADQALWNARRWATIGRPAHRGCINCIAVLTRGKRGGHVGIVREYDQYGNPVILSGNHNGGVGLGTYAKSRVIAYREM